MEAEGLLRMEEAAAVLRISRSKAYQMAARGDLPGAVRIGGSLRVDRQTLRRWITEQAVSPR